MDGKKTCAACKISKKPCTDSCPIKPFYPDPHEDYDDINEVFSVEHLKDWLKKTTDEQKQNLIEALAWESGIRKQDPISGSFGVYKKICEENLQLKVEQKLSKMKIETLEGKIAAISEEHFNLWVEAEELKKKASSS
ncbi:LOB domain-containing protein 2-like [Trifolium medium]|uniref:LOB domain-containing protein 2-like n=1 Tax=Trifolium medium TaxID=97028 RepID=A0A392M7L6_9FABA|nr:LOB domain-containing protein 2-like [Trifolium medium]